MEVQYSREDKTYYIKEKIDNQTFEMQFQGYAETDDTIYFNICMGLYNKRKHFVQNENEIRTTGTNPIKTIAVARKAFKMLESEVIERIKGKNIHISCGWTNNKRRDIYYKFLSKYGYKYGRLGNYKCIYKLIDKLENF